MLGGIAPRRSRRRRRRQGRLPRRPSQTAAVTLPRFPSYRSRSTRWRCPRRTRSPRVGAAPSRTTPGAPSSGVTSSRRSPLPRVVLALGGAGRPWDYGVGRYRPGDRPAWRRAGAGSSPRRALTPRRPGVPSPEGPALLFTTGDTTPPRRRRGTVLRHANPSPRQPFRCPRRVRPPRRRPARLPSPDGGIRTSCRPRRARPRPRLAPWSGATRTRS